MSEQRNQHPVIAYSDAARAKLLAGERSRAARLVRVYGAAYQRLQVYVEALTAQWLAASETGQLTKEQMRALDSYKNLKTQIAQELTRFGEYAGTEMDQGTREVVAQAIKDAKAEVQLSLPAVQPQRLDRVWRNLPNQAIEQLLGMTETGSPLRAKLDKELGDAVAQQVADRILENVALGKNPRETARTVRRELGVGLEWALRTIRTAQLWAYRTAKHQAWAENPRLYRGWTWHAKLGDPRTCPACIAMHGTQHPPDEVLNDHYNGRCAPIIKTPTYAEMLGIEPVPGDVSPADTVENGAEWFAKQTDAFKLQVLGGARFRAYQAGELTMDQGPRGIVGVQTDPVYGDMRHARSLKAILGDDAAGYYERGPKGPAPEPEPKKPLTAQEELDSVLSDLAIPDAEDFGPRAKSADEQGLAAELAEIEPMVQEMIAGGDPTGGGMLGYLDTLKQSLEEETALNEALWEKFGIMPQEATPQQWRELADQIDKDAYALYQKYTKEGISFKVSELRGAKLGRWMVVGSEQIQVREGHFSVAEARRMESRMWGEAKEELVGAFGKFLQRAGYAPGDIEKADYFQRLKLIEELGEKKIKTTSRGNTSKIDAVPVDARGRVVDAIDFDLAATAENVAQSPLECPGVDAYDKMRLADTIRAVKLGGA